MNEAIFEAGHLLGDSPGDQPVTPQEPVLAFEMIVERSRVTISPTDSYAYEAWAKGHNRTLERLTTAHNRDMEAARKRIAALEAENAQLKADKAEQVAAADEVLDAIWETENGFSDVEKYLHEIIEKHKEEK